MSRIIDLADALVVSLNAETWSISAEAVRHYRPVFDLKDLKDLKISVVPRNADAGLSGRIQSMHTVQVDVAIQKKLTTLQNVEIDALVDVVQEVENHVRTTRIIGSGAWLETTNSPVFSQEHLADFRQFTSVLTFTFRLVNV